MARAKRWAIPARLPGNCLSCNARLGWTAVTMLDRVLNAEKVDHYRAECRCGEVHYYDGRGQRVEPALPNLPPDLSEVANTPQGPTPYSGFLEFFAQEKAKAAELAAKRAAAAGANSPQA
jgi:hypothetical protein